MSAIREYRQSSDDDNGKWMVPPYPPYTGKEKWYCWQCDEVTDVERNPVWNGELKGVGWPGWLTRCKVCESYHVYGDEDMGCPECGTPPDEEPEAEFSTTMISQTEPKHVDFFESGGWEEEWEETHKCPHCGTIYTITNSNF